MVVLPAIDLDDEARLVANKIRNVPPERDLPAKAVPGNLPRA